MKRQIVQPDEAATLDRQSQYLKAHMRDGRLYVLRDWLVREEQHVVTGQGILYDPARHPQNEGTFSVAIDSVALFETNRVVRSPSVAALTLVGGVTAAVTIICVTSPKTCFGSCPTFYAQGPMGPTLRAECFSASVAPALEATDIDALGEVTAGRDLELVMRNEALETHIIRHADVLAVPRPPGGRVFATSTGDFWSATSVFAPTKCTAPEGDCREVLSEHDGIERWSLADSVDLAARETIDLEFDAIPGGEMGIAIASRQSLMTTYLFYQSLAFMGSRAGEWIARLERGDPYVRERCGSMGRILGGIEILLPTADGSWSVAGVTAETGPLATDLRLVSLPPLAPGCARVRLRLTRGYWRLDQVQLVALAKRVEPLRLAPREVRNGSDIDAQALACLTDPARVLVTFPGDAYVLAYRLPEVSGRYELFLESRGYYLEWMRQEWIAEEDPKRAALMFLDPERALQLAARDYKQVEAQMEARFWGSRYVRP